MLLRLAKISLFALHVSLFLLLSACGKQEAPDTLVVGMSLSYPPFEMSDEQNRPAGISVDIAKALGDYLGRPTRIENIPFPGLIPALQSDKIDLIISSMTATPARAESIDFSQPYLDTGLALLVPNDSDINSIDDVNRPSRQVAVMQGTTGQLHAISELQQARLLTFEREYAAVLEVVQGRADAFIYDQMSIYQHWQRNPDTTRAILEPFQRESWAIGMRQGEDELRQAINAFIDDFRARGGFDELGDRYLGEQKKSFQELGLPFFF